MIVAGNMPIVRLDIIGIFASGSGCCCFAGRPARTLLRRLGILGSIAPGRLRCALCGSREEEAGFAFGGCGFEGVALGRIWFVCFIFG